VETEEVEFMSIDREPPEEPRDTVAPEPEEIDPADAGSDSPGPPIELPDRPIAANRHGTTAEEQREDPSLERRLAMERPDVFETGRAGGSPPPPKPIVDDDVPFEELNVDEPGFDPEEAELDRTPQVASEQASEAEDEGPEGAAIHIEPEP
jgi:hypothetical protein